MINILLFDDSIYILKFLEAAIEKHFSHANIFKTQTFDEAVEIIHTQPIDVALIDLQVPEKNGADFIHYMKSDPSLRGIKKVIVTETGENSLLKTSLQNEVDAYLHKEDIFDDFQKVLDQLDVKTQ